MAIVYRAVLVLVLGLGFGIIFGYSWYIYVPGAKL